jgi:hypothetical protein
MICGEEFMVRKALTLASLLILGSLVLGWTAPGSATALVTGRPAHVRITLRPPIVAPYDWSTIDITGLTHASAVEVRIVGASATNGTLSPWIPLRRQHSDWGARLPQPVFPGIYPIELRTQPPLATTPRPITYLRVYWPGTSKRPLFHSPEQAVQWWVSHLANGTLVAIRRWPPQAIDHRLTLLHGLFVVAYTPRSPPTQAARLGAWITTVREGSHGHWRVLEAGVTPP